MNPSGSAAIGQLQIVCSFAVKLFKICACNLAAGLYSSGVSGDVAMSIAAKAEPRPLSDAEIVEAYLTASMIPDPDAAAAYMKPGTMITFTGGREFDHPRGPTGFNARRYRWVKKKMDRFDVCPGAGETVVYSIGTLFGEWLDGTPFEANRYDRASSPYAGGGF